MGLITTQNQNMRVRVRWSRIRFWCSNEDVVCISIRPYLVETCCNTVDFHETAAILIKIIFIQLFSDPCIHERGLAFQRFYLIFSINCFSTIIQYVVDWKSHLLLMSATVTQTRSLKKKQQAEIIKHHSYETNIQLFKHFKLE